LPFRRCTLNPRETGGPHLLDALLAGNILDPERGIFVGDVPMGMMSNESSCSTIRAISRCRLA
jgi:hypothetical protein